MKIIQEKFKRWGGDWRLLERDGDIGLFLQDGRNFNVAIIQHSEPREIAGRMTEGGEYLPGEKQYGRLAWNYGTSERRAREKFSTLIRKRENWNKRIQAAEKILIQANAVIREGVK